MTNYPYIIASLPDIALNFEQGGFDYGRTRDEIFAQLGEGDRRMVEWLEFGFDPKKVNSHFYAACRKCRNRFIHDFFGFDFLVRTEKVAYLHGEKTEAEFEQKQQLLKTFAISNVIEREKALDMMLWEKAGEIVTFDVFNIDVILSFLAKARIITRWNKLDKASGEALFRKFIDEINNKVTI